MLAITWLSWWCHQSTVFNQIVFWLQIFSKSFFKECIWLTLTCPLSGFLMPFPYKDKQKLMRFFKETWEHYSRNYWKTKTKKKHLVFKYRHIRPLASEAVIIIFICVGKGSLRHHFSQKETASPWTLRTQSQITWDKFCINFKNSS